MLAIIDGAHDQFSCQGIAADQFEQWLRDQGYDLGDLAESPLQASADIIRTAADVIRGAADTMDAAAARGFDAANINFQAAQSIATSAQTIATAAQGGNEVNAA